MTHKIVVVGGPDRGRSFELEVGTPFVIGRGRTSHTQIQDPRVSRVHCRIEWQGGRAMLIDEDSDGGTLVNGKKMNRTELLAGTVFQIGETLVRYEAPCIDQPTLPPNVPTAMRKLQIPHLADLVGKSMGVFRLDKILTQTQSGMLFLGRDTEQDRPVAMKILTPDIANLETQKLRFVRAMKTMLPVKHPNIVTIYNAGKSGPFCWTAMEYIDGESMTQLIERVGIDGMLDWREVWRVAVHVTRALQFAFEKRIVHRNLTPTNIIRRKSDRVCLLGDLMLAKALEGSTSAMVTEPGGLIGDVAYMAPERTYPSGVADTRSDMYGLGATLYALLTGRPPYAGDTLADLLRQIRDNLPFPPREYQFSVNSEFEDLVMKLLSKRPDHRYQFPAQLLRELERIGRFANVELDTAK